MKAQRAPELRLLSDDPIRDHERDGLELTNWAQVVASAALGSEGPLSIGVFGRWGVGKTSVLHLAKSLVDTSPEAAAGEVTTVFFNAWQYETEETPLVPLIASILQDLEKKKGTRGKSASRLRSALRSALYGLSAEVSGGVPLLGEVSLSLDPSKSIERYETLRSQWIDQQMEKSLSFNAFKALREAQRSGREERHRVVVFVDDLDRCFPDRAVRLLENIKLVLSEPGFIFVLAVDRWVLEAYLDKRFLEFGLREHERGQSYLAKFIQLPLWIPPHDPRFVPFIQKLLESPSLAECRDELMPLSEEIGLACGHNPRQLIRFLNDLLVDRYVFRLGHPKRKFSFRPFVVARGIRLHSEIVYRGLLKSQELRGKIQDCEDVKALRQEIAKDLASLNGNDPSFEILVRIQGNDHLAALLVSEAGREWLADESFRRRVEEFLVTEREVDDRREWIDKMTSLALEQILSEDKGAIVAACHWLAQYESPLRVKAVSRLTELALRDDERVAREAKRTLDVICAGIRP